MGKKLSLQEKKNNSKDTSVILLCAGKGTRFGEITSSLPKALLKIDPLDQVLLEHTIHQLEQFNIEKIGIVTGHLSEQIRTYIHKITKDDEALRQKIVIIDSNDQYQKGPLYSFLSIRHTEDFYIPNQLYLVIPGDTYFETEILKNILDVVKKNKSTAMNSPLIFYRTLKVKELLEKVEHKEYVKDKSISYVELNQDNLRKTLIQIKTSKVRDFDEFRTIEQILPIISIPYNFIEKITNIIKEKSLNTLRGILNYLSSKGRNIIAINIPSKGFFCDIDKKSDLKNLRNYLKKRSGQ
jgi:NDP-sugar pyrophosphorylase family protein